MPYSHDGPPPHAFTDFNTVIGLTDPSNLQLLTDFPMPDIHLSPALAGPYRQMSIYGPSSAVQLHKLPTPTQRLEGAQNYLLSARLPGLHTELVSDLGNTMVLTDGQRTYELPTKQPDVYSNFESRAAVQQLLQEHGFAQRVVLLLDSDQMYRQDLSPGKGIGQGVRILRAPGIGHLPILISRAIDQGPLEELDQDRLVADFAELSEVALEHRLIFNGVRAVHDRETGRVMLTYLDAVDKIEPAAGEQLKVDYPQFRKTELERAAIVAATLSVMQSAEFPKPAIPVERAAEVLSDHAALVDAVAVLGSGRVHI